jgi:hypothetical protein
VVEKKEDWRVFYFSGERYCGIVENKEQWKEVVKAYKRFDLGFDHLQKINTTKFIERYGVPFFSYRSVCGVTLGEWAEQNGMNLL